MPTTTPSSGGGIEAFFTNGSTIIENSIVGNNSATTGPDIDGNFSSLGHNIVSNTSGSLGAAVGGDQFNVDPKLDVLADNGGPTETMALLAGSPAIDAANTATAPATDQRGVPRPFGAAADIGAFESTTPTNNAPVAADDSATTDEDTPISINVLANDSDIDDDSLTVASVGTPAHGTATINADGTVSYSPAANYNGSDSFSYSISDGHGGTATASVSVTVKPVNDPPVAADDSATTDEDTPISINVLANDSDIDDDSLAVASVGTPSHGTATINADGTVSYSPAANYNGSDSFSYSISDGHGGMATASVSVTVNPVNDPPVAANDSATTDEDTPISINVLANDSDVDGDSLTVASVGTPAHGTATINADGTVSYSPAANYNGSDSFSYSISDGHGGMATASVSVTVNPVNDPPVAANDSATTDEDTPISINVLANDSDVDGDSLMVASVGTPAHGTATINADGTVSYSPAANYNGSDSFSYSISDGHGGTATASVSVTVNPVNDPPVAADDSYLARQNTTLNVSASSGVLANDSDPDGDTLTASAATQPAHGTLSLNSDGSFSYMPSAGYHGSDSFSYTVSDGHGASATGQVTITVAHVLKPKFKIHPSQIDLVHNGVITIDLFSTEAFDATQVAVSSVRFAHAAAVRSAFADLNNDGQLDLVMKFRNQDAYLLQLYEALLNAGSASAGRRGIQAETIAAELQGSMLDGETFDSFENVQVFLAGETLEQLVQSRSREDAITPASDSGAILSAPSPGGPARRQNDELD